MDARDPRPPPPLPAPTPTSPLHDRLRAVVQRALAPAAPANGATRGSIGPLQPTPRRHACPAAAPPRAALSPPDVRPVPRPGTTRILISDPFGPLTWRPISNKRFKLLYGVARRYQVQDPGCRRGALRRTRPRSRVHPRHHR